MKPTVKNITFLLLLLLMALPAFQHYYKVFQIRGLDGDFILNERPAFSWDSWYDGTYQNQFDRYLEDHIGLRNFFVRINNQVKFSLFKETNVEGVVIGKDNMLYEFDYIRAYTGGDFIGKGTITKKMQRVKFLQEYLKSTFDIDFVLVYEPSKARYYPEFIPDTYLENGTSLSNYEYLKEKSNELGIRYLDLNTFFQHAKDTTTKPLYPKYGIHWTEYCMSFVNDTLVKYIEEMRGIDLNEFSVTSFTTSDSISDSDYDIGKTMNLLWRLPQPKMTYPNFIYEQDSTKDKPMVLVVGDSYYWNIFNTRLPRHLFANEAFWYFYAKVYPDSYFGNKRVESLDLKVEIEKQDIILLMVTERFMYKFDWGFVDDLYRLYSPDFSGDLVYDYENVIRLDAGWFDDIVLKAKRQGVPLEDAVRDEATYQAITEKKDIFLIWYGLKHYQEIILNNQGWADLVRNKAIERGISFEDMLIEDADYAFKTDYPEIHAKHNLIKKYEDQIKNNPEWTEQVQMKADQYYMSLEDMICVDAEYMANQNFVISDPIEEKIKVYEDLIRNDPAWLESVGKKAQEEGLTLDEMIRKDAIYMMGKEKQDSSGK
nr:hypothetical protein [Bacteroidota bacterium]